MKQEELNKIIEMMNQQQLNKILENYAKLTKGVRYAIMPDFVMSKQCDSQWHFVCFGDLIMLYQLDRKYCIDMSRRFEGSRGLDDKNTIHLGVLYSGEYLKCKAKKLANFILNNGLIQPEMYGEMYGI